jgi:hypothetical protein
MQRSGDKPNFKPVEASAGSSRSFARSNYYASDRSRLQHGALLRCILTQMLPPASAMDFFFSVATHELSGCSA